MYRVGKLVYVPTNFYVYKAVILYRCGDKVVVKKLYRFVNAKWEEVELGYQTEFECTVAKGCVLNKRKAFKIYYNQ